MNGYGLALMTLSCGFVIALNVYCFRLVFRRRHRERHQHGQHQAPHHGHHHEEGRHR